MRSFAVFGIKFGGCRKFGLVPNGRMGLREPPTLWTRERECARAAREDQWTVDDLLLYYILRANQPISGDLA
jgi:hypothetical protein